MSSATSGPAAKRLQQHGLDVYQTVTVTMNKMGLVVLFALAIFAIAGLVWGLTGPHGKHAQAETGASVGLFAETK